MVQSNDQLDVVLQIKGIFHIFDILSEDRLSFPEVNWSDFIQSSSNVPYSMSLSFVVPQIVPDSSREVRGDDLLSFFNIRNDKQVTSDHELMVEDMFVVHKCFLVAELEENGLK